MSAHSFLEQQLRQQKGTKVAERTIDYDYRTIRADELQRGDRIVATFSDYGGPPIINVRNHDYGSISVHTVNGGARVFNPWEAVDILRPPESSMTEPEVWSATSVRWRP